mmetsp:Transcript_67031/g.111424  ORF Transcript_67031/g.111424 Transcript_67031/m.111424 type:complete len:179 (-) Transcript_67031:44-580(-)
MQLIALVTIIIQGWSRAQSHLHSKQLQICTRNSRLAMVSRVRIVSVGKTKEVWLQEAIGEYTKRLRATLDVQCEWVRDDRALVAEAQRPGCIVLDERGSQCSSEEFSHILFDALEQGGSRLSFIIGAADGLPPSIRNGPHRLLSLSRMTFTHQMARLLLVEQIYRACEIRRGSKYHRR